jgi:hypothetical protein
MIITGRGALRASKADCADEGKNCKRVDRVRGRVTKREDDMPVVAYLTKIWP